MIYEYKSDKPLFIPLYSLLLIIGISLLYLAGDNFLETRKFLASAIETKGTVAELVNSDDVYMPVFEFRDHNNNVIRFEHNIGSNPAAWKKDEEVRILYDPDFPNDHRIISYWGLFRPTIVLMMIGLSITVVSAGYFLFLRNVSRW
jgi:hypothetical protein